MTDGTRGDVLVLGAGIVGTSIGIHLLKRGFRVTLVDRRGPGEETSYGNAGVIERESLEPVGIPRDPLKLLSIALQRAPEAHYHASYLPRALPWLWKLWQGGSADALERYAVACNALSSEAAAEHHLIAAQAGCEAYFRKDGWIRLYRSEAGFAATKHLRMLAERFGVPYTILDADGVAALEPALTTRFPHGLHWPTTETVSSPGGVTQSYARYFQVLGGQIVQAEARGIARHGAGWSVTTGEGTLTAGKLVVAMGVWSADLVKPFGLKLPLAAKRGYHLHFKPMEGYRLTRPVVDEEKGYLLTPMEQGIRLTSGVEIADREAPATPVQIDRLKPIARSVLPMGDAVEAEPWLGRRPAFPDSLPVIGTAPGLDGLWMAFGHGHLGFTQGPVTGRLIAEMMSGDKPSIDPRALQPVAVRLIRSHWG